MFTNQQSCSNGHFYNLHASKTQKSRNINKKITTNKKNTLSLLTGTRPGVLVEVRDSRTGYFIPVRYGLGLLPDGIVVGTSSPSASPGNHLEKVTLTVLVFGPEWVSYERSRRMQHAKMREISARVFFVKISKSQDSMIYTILRFFRIHIPKMDSFANVSVTRPGRPPARTVHIIF